MSTVARRRTPTFLVVLLTGSVITMVSMGLRSTMGVFLDPMTDALGVGAGTFSLMVALQNLMWGLGQPAAGAVADRYGTRRVLVVGAALYAAGLVSMAGADGGLGLQASGVLVGLGTAGASFTVVLAAVGRLAPEEKRSMALGIATAAGSVGQFVFVPSARLLIDAVGWRSALLVGAAAAAAMAAACVPIRLEPLGTADRGDVESLGSVLHRAGRHRSYVLLVVGFFVCGFHVSFIGAHLPKHLDDLGQSAGIGAMALALVGLFNLPGTIGAGALGATRSRVRLLAWIYGLRGVVFVVFLLLPASGGLSLAFGAVIGVLWLSTVPLTSGVVMAQFGLDHAGTLFGLAFLSHQLGSFVGVYGGGLVRDATGSYDVWWWTLAALGFGGAVLHLFIDEDPAPAPVPASGLSTAEATPGA